MFRHSEHVRSSLGNIFVPPFQCAWLQDFQHLIPSGKTHLPLNRGGVEFAVRGANDATVMLKSSPATSRLHTWNSYCVIFGSNRNKCLRIERDGEYKTSLAEPWTKLNAGEYKTYWVYYQDGTIYVGAGTHDNTCLYSWTDPDPVHGISHWGLSSWDTHLTYRDLRLKTESQLVGELRLPSLLDICLKAISKDLTVEKACLVLVNFGETVVASSEELMRKSLRMVAMGFEEAARMHVDALCVLSRNAVAEVLTSPDLSAHWDEVLRIVVLWSFHGEQPSMTADLRSEEDIVEILKLIRFHFIDEEVLQELLSSPLARRISDCRMLVEAGRQIKEDMVAGKAIDHSGASGDSLLSSSFHDAMLQPHGRPHGYEFVFQHNGDSNGVCYGLGTQFGQRSWFNPMICRDLTVRTSSPSGRHTIPKEVVGNRFLTSSYSAPRREDGNSNASWSVDFHSRRLVCTHYSMRHDASDGYARAWSLQGSNNGVDWVDLRRNTADYTINSKGQWASWPVHTDRSYKKFRVLQTGPNASAINPHHFCLSSIEFYGILLGNVRT